MNQIVRRWRKPSFKNFTFSFRFSLYPVVIGVANAAYFTYVFGFYSDESFRLLSQWAPDNIVTEDFLLEHYALWIRTVVSVGIFEVIAIFVFSMFYSQRFSGPLFAISRGLSTLISGHIPDPIHLRRSDYLHELVEELNLAFEALRKDRNELVSSLETSLQDIESNRMNDLKERLQKRLEELKA